MFKLYITNIIAQSGHLLRMKRISVTEPAFRGDFCCVWKQWNSRCLFVFRAEL